MFRATDMVLIAAMVATAGFTYTTKHAAEAELTKLRKVDQAIRFEEESIDVLKADWSLLTQPSRLQMLSETFAEDLQLVPVEPHQFAEIEDLPMRPLRIEDVIGEQIEQTVEIGVDADTTTGGVTR